MLLKESKYRSRSRLGKIAEIPTSSMSDVAFLLILFFMLTAVFSSKMGLEFELPAIEDGTKPDPAVLVHVFADRMEVDCTPMQNEELVAYLEPKLARNPNKPLILYVDGGAPYQRMIEMYDLFIGIGALRNVQVPTQADVDQYIATFQVNPLDSHCR